MPTSQLSEFVEPLRRALLLHDGAARTDGQLLEDYLSRHDQAALGALVVRHGPMVWGVCRRVLCNHHDAEDAFQATWLVLVRRADSIMPKEMVANWLYGVAQQTALKARATAARRKGGPGRPRAGCPSRVVNSLMSRPSARLRRWPWFPPRSRRIQLTSQALCPPPPR